MTKPATLIRLDGCPDWYESSLGGHSFCWFCHVAERCPPVLCLVPFLFEPQHDKTNTMTCAPSEDSDQPGDPLSLISHRCPHEETWVLSYPLSAQRVSDQTGRMPRLIWVFARRTLILLSLSCRWKRYPHVLCLVLFLFEPQHDKTNKMTCAPSEDSYQPGHPWIWNSSSLAVTFTYTWNVS